MTAQKKVFLFVVPGWLHYGAVLAYSPAGAEIDILTKFPDARGIRLASKEEAAEISEQGGFI